MTTDDFGDAEQDGERQLRAQSEEERDVAYLKWVLSSQAGRAVIWRILRKCYMFEKVVTHPQETFRQEGRRDVGIELLDECFTADPNSYTIMRQEDIERNQGES